MMRNCVTCGRFVKRQPGVSWANMYDFVGMQLDHEAVQCAACTKEHGPVHSNAKPADGDMRPYEGVVT